MTREYWHPHYGCADPEEIRNADERFQREVMKSWFLANFEQPIECLPYEGEYIYIWGGPYRAAESLWAEFGDLIPEERILELADEIEEQAECYAWSPVPDSADLIDYGLISAIIENTRFRESFDQSIESTMALLDIELYSDQLKQSLWRLLHVNVISAMEAYLSDAFFHVVFADVSARQRFVETNPDFQKRKFCLSDIYERMETLQEEVAKCLSNVIYHRLGKVKRMYRDALHIDFPEDLSPISRAVNARHDIVHRSGRRKEGKALRLEREDVANLVDEIVALVDVVDSQLVEKYGDVLSDARK
ncbi:MAG: hypothetical protein ACOC6F_00880 [bacterium]